MKKLNKLTKIRSYKKIKQIVTQVCNDYDVAVPSLGYGPPASPSPSNADFYDSQAYYDGSRHGIIMTQRSIRPYTILHEIAHAIVKEIHGTQDDPHGYRFQTICKKLFYVYIDGYAEALY